MYFSGRILTPVLPSIGARLVDYFSETSQSDSSSIAFLKGLPYFFITIYGIVNSPENKLPDKTKAFDVRNATKSSIPEMSYRGSNPSLPKRSG